MQRLEAEKWRLFALKERANTKQELLTYMTASCKNHCMSIALLRCQNARNHFQTKKFHTAPASGYAEELSLTRLLVSDKRTLCWILLIYRGALFALRICGDLDASFEA